MASTLCPRCEYDVSGLRASAEARCPECGVNLDWHAIDRAEFAPRWSFEHGSFVAVTALAATLLRLLMPTALFSRTAIRMENPVRTGRLVFLAVVCLVIGHLSAAGATAWAAYHGSQWKWATNGGVNAPIVVWGATTTTPSSAKVPQPAESAVRGAISPYWGMGAALPQTRIVNEVAGVGIAMLATTPLAMLITSATLWRSKIRFWHVIRGWAYFIAGGSIMLAIGLLARLVLMSAGVGLTGSGPPILSTISPLLLMLWSVVYVPSLFGRYLRIEHAFPASALVLAIAWGFAIAFVAIWPNSTFFMHLGLR